MVVRDYHDGVFVAFQFVYPIGNNSQSIDIQSRIGFVKNGQFGLQHGHLENLVTFFLSARKSFVQGTRQKFAVNFQQFRFLANHFQHLVGRHFFQSIGFTSFVDGRSHKVGHRNSRNFNWILERKENTFVCSFFRSQFRNVFVVQEDFSFGHFIIFVSGNDGRKRTFSGTIGSHNGVNFSRFYFKVDSFKNFFVANRGV